MRSCSTSATNESLHTMSSLRYTPGPPACAARLSIRRISPTYGKCIVPYSEALTQLSRLTNWSAETRIA